MEEQKLKVNYFQTLYTRKTSIMDEIKTTYK